MSLADNNLSPAGKWPWQTSNFDGSRAGQWDNSQGYFGVSHPVFGTLTFGRTNSLSFDVTSAYDPVASIAFSALGFSNAFPGFGDTETARPNTAFTYRLTYQNFRAAAQAQIGGYDWGNATQGIVPGPARRRLRAALARRDRQLGQGRGVALELHAILQASAAALAASRLY